MECATLQLRLMPATEIVTQVLATAQHQMPRIREMLNSEDKQPQNILRSDLYLNVDGAADAPTPPTAPASGATSDVQTTRSRKLGVSRRELLRKADALANRPLPTKVAPKATNPKIPGDASEGSNASAGFSIQIPALSRSRSNENDASKDGEDDEDESKDRVQQDDNSAQIIEDGTASINRKPSIAGSVQDSAAENDIEEDDDDDDSELSDIDEERIAGLDEIVAERGERQVVNHPKQPPAKSMFPNLGSIDDVNATEEDEEDDDEGDDAADDGERREEEDVMEIEEANEDEAGDGDNSRLEEPEDDPGDKSA